MTNFLVKSFVKDAAQIDDPTVRQRYGVLSGAVGICCNLLLSTAKISAGLLTASISVLADGLNNLSDIASSVVTLAGFKLAGKTPDKEHPFGHGRMEYIAGLLVALVIVLMGVELFKSSVQKIIAPETAEFSLVSVIILAASIGIKLWMYFFNRRLDKKINSAAMRATARDSLSDSAATAVVLGGILLFRVSGINVDGYTGAAVALFILYTGLSSAKETLDPLLGQAPGQEFTKGIEAVVLSHPEVIGVHELIVHDYGPGRCMISLHAEVPSSMNVLAAHDVMDCIEHELQQKYRCVATLHMDPIVMDNELTNTLKSKVQGFLSELSPELSMHDFRITNGPLHKNIIFDVVLPQGFSMSEEDVVLYLRDQIRQIDASYFAVINIDRPYV